MFLQENGFSNAQCGLAIMLQYTACVLLQPLYGYLTDTYITCKRFLMIVSLLSIPAAFLLPLSVRSVPLAIASIITFACFYNSNDSIITVWLLLLRDERPHIKYEVTRGITSALYAVFAFGFGAFLERFGTRVMFGSYGLLAALFFLACLPMPEVACQNTRKSLQANGAPLTSREVASALLHNRSYVLFVLSALCFQIGIRATKTFLSNYVSVVGGAQQEMGLLLSLSALVEMPILFVMSRINRRIPVEYSYLVVLLAHILYLYCLLAIPTMAGLTVAQVFSGITYSAELVIFMQFIKQNTPRQMNSSAISLGMAASVSMASIFGSFFGGMLLDRFGISALTLVCMGFAVVGILLFLPLIRHAKRAAEPEINR